MDKFLREAVRFIIGIVVAIPQSDSYRLTARLLSEEMHCRSNQLPRVGFRIDQSQELDGNIAFPFRLLAVHDFRLQCLVGRGQLVGTLLLGNVDDGRAAKSR